MKGIAHGRVGEDRQAAIAPFGFQIGHGVLPLNHLAVLIFDLELPITRNVGEVVRDPLIPFGALTSFTTTCGAQRTMVCNFRRT